MKSRIIKTGLRGDKAESVCSSIISQMSDGYWEDCHEYEKYWRFASIKKSAHGEIAFKIDPRCFIDTFRGLQTRRVTIRNGFSCMEDSEVLGFFSKKIKFILRKELADDGVKLNKKAAENIVCWLSSNGVRLTVRDVEDVIRGLDGAAIAAGIAESSVD